MAPEEIATRLSRIEARRTALESRFAPAAQARPVPPPPQGRTVPPPPGRAPTPARMEVSAVGDAPSFATSVLGWGGALALVLAAAYLIRLAIDTGWLTPLRQIALAGIAGLAMVAGGFALRGSNRPYAGLLPAGGGGSP